MIKSGEKNIKAIFDGNDFFVGDVAMFFSEHSLFIVFFEGVRYHAMEIQQIDSCEKKRNSIKIFDIFL